MKALDTNVLIRYLVADDPVQTRTATEIIEGAAGKGQHLFLSLLVLCESAWVLERRYRQSRAAIADTLDLVLDTAVFAVERSDLLRRCVDQFRMGKAGLADYVTGAIAMEAGCTATFTFDRDLAGCRGFRVR